jgi:hypothetical protein
MSKTCCINFAIKRCRLELFERPFKLNITASVSKLEVSAGTHALASLRLMSSSECGVAGDTPEIAS